MTNKKNDTEDSAKKNNVKNAMAMRRKMPHSFPITIRVSATDEVAFVDFASRNGDELEAFASVVLSKRMAKNLVVQLSEFTDSEVVDGEDEAS